MARFGQRHSDAVFYGLMLATAAALVGSIELIFLSAPIEATMGTVQKIFYFHVPAAIAMYVGAVACFVGSAAYLVSPTDRRDALAKAGAQIAVLFGVMVLVTGPLWAAKAWGRYWTWDPRLTTSLLSVLIYVAYVILRSFAGDGEAERKFAAALGVVGAANLPIIHFSVQKWSGQHPRVISSGGGGLGEGMKLPLMTGFVAFLLLAAVLLWLRYRIELLSMRAHHLEDEMIQQDIAEAS